MPPLGDPDRGSGAALRGHWISCRGPVSYTSCARDDCERWLASQEVVALRRTAPQLPQGT